MIEQSKICTETMSKYPKRVVSPVEPSKVRNLKALGDSAERAGETRIRSFDSRKG
jgi:hypothetical protein